MRVGLETFNLAELALFAGFVDAFEEVGANVLQAGLLDESRLWGSITRCAYAAWEYSLISPARTWRRRTGGVASADRWTRPITRWIRRLIRSRVAEFVEDGGEAEVVGTPVVRR